MTLYLILWDSDTHQSKGYTWGAFTKKMHIVASEKAQEGFPC